VGIVTDDAVLRAAVERFAAYIRSETLAVRVVFDPLPGVEPIELKVGSSRVKLYIQVVSA